MKHTSKFTFSIALILLSFLVNAQQKKTDSIPPKIEKFGIRVGADLFKLTRSFYDKNYKGIEFVGDYRLTKNYYLAAELGNENKTTEDDRLNSTAKGTYIKAGFDYNSYENWLDMRNMVFIGLRYGASTFSQQLNSYKLYNTSTYFPEAPTVISGDKFNGLSAQWFEVVVGMKAEVLKNIYVGFSVRMNKILSNTKPENFDNLYIPGFNRTYNGDFGVGFNYTVSYFLPLYKTKSSPKKVIKKK
jgi:hypothetical protein